MNIHLKKGLHTVVHDFTLSAEIGFFEDVFLRDSFHIESNLQLVKSFKGRNIYKASLESGNFYLKVYRYKSFSKILKNQFRPAEALRNLKTCVSVIASGIQLAEPVAAVIQSKMPFYKDSMYISREFPGVNFQEFLCQETFSNEEKQKVIEQIAILWAKLYQNNVLNTDPNLPGIVVNKKNNSFEAAIVDTDNLEILSKLTKKQILINLANFNAHSYSGLARINQNDKLTTNDRKLFFECVFEHFTDISVNQQDYDFVNAETINILKKWKRLEHIKF
jgi:hypothetical protein